MSAAVCTILEVQQGRLHRKTAALAALARGFAQARAVASVAIIVGPDAEAAATAAASYFDTVYWSKSDVTVCENAAPAAWAVASSQQLDIRGLFAHQSALGLDAAALFAAMLNLSILSDVSRLETRAETVTAFARKLGGAVTSELAITSNAAVVFVCAPDDVAEIASATPGTVEESIVSTPDARVEMLASSLEQQDEISLDAADTIVSGGKGLGGPEPFTGMLRDLAQALGGAVGASRAVVDAGWVPHALQIGQTGRTVAPKLYFALGISGQIQHRVGMQTAGTIVAINTDAKAPIAQFSDLLVVGDLHSIVPALTRLLREEKVHP